MSTKKNKTPKSKKKTAPRQQPAKAAGGMSALDAAAEVLRSAGTAMNCKDLVAQMAEKGLWTSPGGKTPHSTLYASIMREIVKRGDESRFKKADRGMFALAA